MGKKYLDTKQSTIEASVLDVWAKSSEEQEAIRNAAEMMVQEKMSALQLKRKELARNVRRFDTKPFTRDPYLDEPQVKAMKKRKHGGKGIGWSEPDWSGAPPAGPVDQPGDVSPIHTAKRGQKTKLSRKQPIATPKKGKLSRLIGMGKKAWQKLTQGDFIGMTAYMNTLNEDQSPDQIAVVIGDINETELTLINPENLDQTMSINLENLQVDINEDGELEISEGWFKDLVDKKTGASASSRNVHGTGTGHNIPALKQYNKEVDLAKKQGRNWKPGTKGAPKVPQEYKLPHQK